MIGVRPATVAVMGAGPAGLMAAEVLSDAGLAVTVYERMPSVGRKLLLAGRGGLNLTHTDQRDAFLARYGAAADRLAPVITAFPPDAVRAWAHGLGQETFVGSSGRVFPRSMKASPLLRAWLGRLAGQGVMIITRHEWRGWDDAGGLVLSGRDGTHHTVGADAAVLAMGGASWPRLGSDGAWVEPLRRAAVAVAELRPANCGFEVAWSEHFRTRFAGTPLKRVALSFAGTRVPGEAMITAHGIEGGAVYALSAPMRDAIAAEGRAVATVDLRPDVSEAELVLRLGRLRPGESIANGLRKAAGLPPAAIGLLREGGGIELPREATALAALIKSVPLLLTAPRPLARTISTAGGVELAGVDEHLMLRARPGVFVAGEMLDWEAPTGGYLLQACFASGAAAARGAIEWLKAGGS